MGGYKYKGKVPDQLHSGRFRDMYQRLFLDRLKREGRQEAFTKRRQELYYGDQIKYKHWDHTWWPAAREFGFISKQDEINRYEDFMIQGSQVKARQEVRAMQEEIRRERENENLQSVLDKLGTASEMDLPADILWVYNHPAMLRKTDDDGDVALSLEDMEGAPGKGAVGMLQYFVRKKADFYKLVLAHLSKRNVSGKEDTALEDDLRKVDEIDAMLGTIE
jgi:hypothetical protein